MAGSWIACVDSNVRSRLKHRTTKIFLWSDSFNIPSWLHHENFTQTNLFSLADEQHQATSFVASLRVCAKNKDLQRGIHVHDDILRAGLLHKCSDALVTMYAKCGALANAKEIFEKHITKNVYTWNALIGGYADKGQGHDALNYFERMQYLGLSPDPATFTCVLKACGSIGAADKGAQLHDIISKCGYLRKNLVLGNALISMYAKCSNLLKAQQVFEELPGQDVISWNALITGYVQHGKYERALHCFKQMKCEGISPDVVTFICVLKACGTMKVVDKGKEIHDEVLERGLLKDNIMLQNVLVDMYAKCGALEKARQVLWEQPVHDEISWSTLIIGYAQQGDGEQAMDCFDQMKREGLIPNAITYIGVIQACGIMGAINKGIEIHDLVVRKGLLKGDLALGNALVDMYAKLGALMKARQVLDDIPIRDVITWTSLIHGYVQHDKCGQALSCVEEMQREGVHPNAVTFICVLKACANIAAINKGEELHEEIVKRKLLGSDMALGNALVDMYAKCGALAKARQMLEELPSRDIISWSALIEGYAQQGEGEQAISCFKEMCHEGLRPNAVTYISILKACASVGAADKGKLIHDEIAKQGLLGTDVALDTSLVDMYAKCNSLAKAQEVLEELPIRDVICWNALIAALVQEGKSEHALSCFKQMQQENISPDAATFSCVLNACSHLGRVEDAGVFFGSMSRVYGMEPGLDHYSCIVDLFARTGELNKAAGVIEKLPLFGGNGAWSALLAACGKWGDANVGRWAFDHALQVDKNDPAFYVLMGNVCAAACMQLECE